MAITMLTAAAALLAIGDPGAIRLVLGALALRVGLTAITVALIAWGFYSGQLVSHVTW